MSQYIPDITERFPEGFGGVDLTDSYFPSERGSDYQFWANMEIAFESEIEAEEERQKGKHTCLNCRSCYEEYGMTNCKKHDITLENEAEECCEDWN